MGTHLDLDDLVADHPLAKEQLERLRKVADAALLSVQNPAWSGVCDEDVALEAALKDAGLWHDRR